VVARRRRSARQRRRRRRLIALWVVVALLVGLGAFTGGLLAAPVDFAQPAPPKSALLLDASGQLFATIRSPQSREQVPGNQIPKVMRQAIVAAEDERFFQHSGVDPLAMLRAAWRDISGSPLQGGSTITQQYVKDVYVGDQRTALRKLREAALAFRLEHHVSKSEILTRYLNGIYLGNGTYGVQAASKFYFGVPVKDLDLDATTGKRDPILALSRASLLAGMGPAPSVWNPIRDPAAARKRQLYTLNRMVANDMISADQASAAYGHSLPTIVAQRAPEFPTIAPEFRDLVEQSLRQRFGDQAVDVGGLKVTTTLDLRLQQAMVQALAQVLPDASDPEAAVDAVDPRTGDIRAMTEKKDGGYQRGGFNLVSDARRSSGSTIKPFTLAAALEAGHKLDEVVYAPRIAKIPNPGGTPNPYVVRNAGDGEGGRYVSLRAALADSINTVYGPLANQVGLRKVFDLAQAAGMGPASSFQGLQPAKALGVEISPLSEAEAYSTLMNHGVHHDVRVLGAVSSADGAASYTAPKDPAGNAVMPRSVADQVVQAMGDVVTKGTGTAAQQPFPVYGKTGTTDDYTNAWFTGCTPTLCITVWMGYDKEYLNANTPHSMLNVHGVSPVYGGTLPAQIFARTWDAYRALQKASAQPAPKPTLLQGPTTGLQPTYRPVAPPTPVHTRVTSAPSPHPTVSATRPPPTSSPSPSPTGGGLPIVGGGGGRGGGGGQPSPSPSASSAPG
jgi:membrane peptidoglycan carboxypeptidase